MVLMKKIYGYVDANKEKFVSDLQTLIQQPSISAQNKGVRECAELLVSMMESKGIKSSIIETDGHPLVFGQYDVGAKKTLLIYNHYDVQPPEPLEEWMSPPFAAKIIGDRIIGRGATDCKGNLMSNLEAVEAFKKTVGNTPINVKFLFDGEEEIGSPSLPRFIEDNKDLLAADSVISTDAGFCVKGRPELNFGSCGIINVQLDVEAASKDLHSSRSRLVPNAAWRLVWALASLKDEKENILIPGFYNKVKSPTAEQRRYIEEAPWDDDDQKKSLGLVGKPFLGDVKGDEALEKLMFTPTCDICGFLSGYTGLGPKSVLPHRASAKLSFRLVIDQNHNEIFESLVKHLKHQGFGDVKAEKTSFVEPSRSEINSDIAKSIISASEEVYGVKPMIKPTGEASGRTGNWIGNRLDLPAAKTGIGPPDWFGHAPNEFMTISHYINGIKFAATILQNFSKF